MSRKYKVSRRYRTVRSLLSDRARWTRGTFARSATGEPVSARGSSAVKFCLLGATHRIGGPDLLKVSEMRNKIRKAMESLYNCSAIAAFNDDPNRRYSEIKAVLKLANV